MPTTAEISNEVTLQYARFSGEVEKILSSPTLPELKLHFIKLSLGNLKIRVGAIEGEE